MFEALLYIFAGIGIVVTTIIIFTLATIHFQSKQIKRMDEYKKKNQELLNKESESENEQRES